MFLQVDNQKLHFYMLGAGPALVLFHASPSSASSVLPLANALSQNYTVFCFDTPGYGRSTHLAEKPTHLADYTKVFHAAFEKLGIHKPAIYGTATGAQIAVRYGNEYPDSVSHLFLDNSAHFDDDLADEITANYFPDLTPRLDGSHLHTVWNIVANLFQYFPWCLQTDEYALNRPQMPNAVLQMIAIDYLKAGATYDVAYRFAFQHERAKYVKQLQVPTTIFRWNNGILTKYVDRLLAHDFQDHIQSLKIDGNATERIQQMVTHINGKASECSSSEINTSQLKIAEAIKCNYNMPSDTPPEVQSGGKHLNSAWSALVKHNPSFDANQIQAALVDWYSNT